MSFVSTVIALFFGMAFAVPATDWKSQPAITFDKTSLSKGKIGPERPSKYVTLDLPYEPFQALHTQIQIRAKVELVTRGEAHVTLVTPPEFEKLVTVLAPAEIRGVIEKHTKLDDAKAICIGQGAKENDQTWFVVIEMPSALKARKELQTLFLKKVRLEKDAKKKELAEAFKPDEFFPHVTLGFKSKDLHLQDGVTKSVATCKYPFY